MIELVYCNSIKECIRRAKWESGTRLSIFFWDFLIGTSAFVGVHGATLPTTFFLNRFKNWGFDENRTY
jgi:hypothetical protein